MSETTWRYRVGITREGECGIYEFYSDAEGYVGVTANPVAAYGLSVEELRTDLERMLGALDEPEIEIEEFGND